MEIREKAILTGLFLSKFDKQGLTALGFNTYTEAFNIIGLALEIKPASIKLYRDEFDSIFPNNRKGWQREIRQYCQDVYDEFKNLDLDNFVRLIKDIIYQSNDFDTIIEEDDTNTSFAKRLITGKAAENYFQEEYQKIKIFSHYELENTTQLGCGFDFKLHSNNGYIAVEVKGLNGLSGNISLTNKEHFVANTLNDKYFLFVVKNFKKTPDHTYYQNPLTQLSFNRIEQKIIQTSWQTNV